MAAVFILIITYTLSLLRVCRSASEGRSQSRDYANRKTRFVPNRVEKLKRRLARLQIKLSLTETGRKRCLRPSIILPSNRCLTTHPRHTRSERTQQVFPVRSEKKTSDTRTIVERCRLLLFAGPDAARCFRDRRCSLV